MTKRLVLVGLAVVLALMYAVALPTVIGHAAAIPIPCWWNPLFSSQVSAILSWLVTVHTFAVLVASLPFALAIERIYGRTGVWIALTLTIAVYVLTRAWSPFMGLGPNSTRIKVIDLFDAINLIGFLPALVW